jgi:hypothetical protein
MPGGRQGEGRQAGRRGRGQEGFRKCNKQMQASKKCMRRELEGAANVERWRKGESES